MAQTSLKDGSTSPTEADLLSGFSNWLSNENVYRATTSRILLPELDGLQGRPDLVDIHLQALPSAINLDDLAASLRSPAQARILANLRFGATRSQAHLEKSSGFTKQALRSHLKELEKNGLVELNRNSAVSLSCPLTWGMARIVTYEGKLTNWRRAFHQALGYRSFSHNVWVVMPPSGAQQAQKIKEALRANGIGLIAYDRETGPRIVIKGRRIRPASRRLYLMAVGAALTKFVERQRRSHRRIRPESIQSI